MPKKFLKNLAKFLRLQKAVEHFGLFRGAEKKNLPKILAQNIDCFADPELKLKVYEILLELRRQIRKKFGLLIVLGWRREWNEKYISMPDATQNIFRAHCHFDLKHASFRHAVSVIKKTIDFDGAIIITCEGIIIGSGLYLENFHPKEVVKILHPTKTEDLSSAFGFAQKVHTRHLAAIAASYTLRGTTVFVLSEEDNTIRIMEKGRIIWSTVGEEISRIVGAEKYKDAGKKAA